MAGKGKLHFGGLPTGPDVRALNEAFPDLKEGAEISYTAIGEVLRIQYGDPRFRTVLTAWRHAKRNEGFLTCCIPGKALRIMTEKEAPGYAFDGARWAARKIRRTARDVSALRPKDENVRTQLDHAKRLLWKSAEAMKETEKQLAAPNVIQLPRALPEKSTAEAS